MPNVSLVAFNSSKNFAVLDIDGKREFFGCRKVGSRVEPVDDTEHIFWKRFNDEWMINANRLPARLQSKAVAIRDCFNR